MTAIPARIRHLGTCTHPQTPYARRTCRRAMIAAAQTPAPAYSAGDEIDLGGDVVTLCARAGRDGVRWFTWSMNSDEGSVYSPTAEAAIEAAKARLTRRCRCGAPATMTASLGPACIRHYDRLSA